MAEKDSSIILMLYYLSKYTRNTSSNVKGMGKMTLEPPMLLTSKTADEILDGRSWISLDLGLSKEKICFRQGRAILRDKAIKLEDLKLISDKPDSIFFIEYNNIYSVAIADKHFFKLVPTDGAPTLEIDGIRMHRTKEITPDIDAIQKIEALGLIGGLVLDTCTGLGYTAIEALKKKAEAVVTVEKEPNVLRIASMNPWSVRLFESGSIHKIIGDSFYLLDGLPQEIFDYVIHDPPRLRLAGDLYGKNFYLKLFRVMKSGGRFFHYVGKPGSRYRGVDIRRGVIRRLQRAGFRGLKYYEKLVSVIGEKPG